MKRYIFTLAVLTTALLCLTASLAFADSLETPDTSNQDKHSGQAKALLAGGCFWCMEKPFEELDGVESVVSGYAGGTSKSPTYNNYGASGHIEVVQITFDPEIVSYEILLDIFWRQIDPTDRNGQFVDRGHEYSSAIFYHDKEQKHLALESKENLAESQIFNREIVTPILPAVPFWPAEEYHQDYYKKNPLRYKYYRSRSGRDQFLNKHWKDRKPGGDPHYADAIASLTPMQFEVTQKHGTEPAYHNLYWDNKEDGIYVDIVSGEPLFSSADKYDSKTGWPSFTQPLIAENIVERSDMTWLTIRTEVRSKKANSHLGHVFNDGPPPAKLRYCINSAALRFVKATHLTEEGYEEFTHLFRQP